MTIQELKQKQARHRLTDTHLLYTDEDNWVMAHTDDERQNIKLTDCPLHKWITALADAPIEPGTYIVETEQPRAGRYFKRSSYYFTPV